MSARFGSQRPEDPGSRQTEGRPAPPRHPGSASWRSALRLAWREARHHKGGSLLIIAMIGLPVMIICAGAALLATTDVDAEESLPVTVGRAQALITTYRGAVEQTVDGQLISQDMRPAASPVPGHVPGQPWTVAQLRQLTDGRVGVSAMRASLVEWSGSSRTSPVRVIGHDVLASSGLVDLVEGRLPAGPGQILVTETGVAAGLPRAGSLRVALADHTATAEITGVVRAAAPDYGPVDLVLGEEWVDPRQTTDFLVVRDDPVTWADVSAWNAAGIAVVSPAVIADPPSGVPTRVGTGAGNTVLVVLISLGLVLETALLAGPAFAVSAARRRRSLALITANGADPGQMVRFVTAQGVLLGGVAVALGAVLGTVLGWLGVRVLAGVLDPSGAGSIGRPPLDTYGWAVVMITAAALAAAVIAALVTGLRGGGGDTAAALADRPAVGGRPAVGMRRTGMAIMLAGALLVVLSLVFAGSYTSLLAAGVGGALLVIGALFVVPLVLSRVGRWLATLPAAPRMGVRDATRARARSVPAIAAVVVVVAALTMITISARSDDAQSRRDYAPATLPGAGIVDAYGPVQATLDQIRAQHPAWTVQPSGSVGTDDGTGDAQRVSGVAAGCTPEQAIAPYDGSRQPDACQIFGSDNGWDITVAAVNTINPAAALSSDQRRQLEDGSLLATSPELVRDGRARVALTSHGPDPTGPGSLVKTIEVPAVVITVDQYRALAYARNQADGAIMTAAGAKQAGLPWTTYRWEIVDPAGPISQTDEQAINGWAPTPMLVERGYQSSSLILVVLLGIAVALVLVGALTATALTQVEAAPEQATLAAVGATGGFRRWVAAAQATLIAGLGALLGAALGIVPGLGLAATLTTDWDPAALDPVFVVPYAEMAVVVLAVPLVAGVLAALMVRGSLGLRRRPT